MTTKANMALTELAEKGGDADFLREMIQLSTAILSDGPRLPFDHVG